MLQFHAFAPEFLVGLVTVVALAVNPARGPERTGEATAGLAAIPAGQQDADFDLQTTTSTGFVNIPNSVVTIDNGTSSRNVIVTFSADAAVSDDGDTFGFGVRIDSGSCLGGGPVNFTRSTFFETRTAVEVQGMGPGTHTIRPCWFVVPDADGAQSIKVLARTLIAEGRTK